MGIASRRPAALGGGLLGPEPFRHGLVAVQDLLSDLGPGRGLAQPVPAFQGPSRNTQFAGKLRRAEVSGEDPVCFVLHVKFH